MARQKVADRPARGVAGEVPESTAEGAAGGETASRRPARVADRHAPLWVNVIAWCFGAATAACFLSLAVAAYFFADLVVGERDARLAGWLLAVALAPVGGVLILGYAHARALAGFRWARTRAAARAEAALALFTSIVLAAVHPALAAGLAFAAAASLLCGRFARRARDGEPWWDFNADEAASVLAGRDGAGFAMAAAEAGTPALAATLHRVAVWGGVLVAIAAAAHLVATEYLAAPTVLAVTLATWWGGGAFASLAFAPPAPPGVAHRAKAEILPGEPDGGPPDQGLCVRNLSVTAPGGKPLLGGVSFDVAPGTLVGVVGPTGAGKSLLCKALVAPHDLCGLTVSGAVHLNGRSLWERSPRRRDLPAVLLPETPLLLPASGRANLTCFRHDGSAEAGRRVLENLVFSHELTEEILSAPDATHLPMGQRRALVLARAFALAPWLYAMDGPETGAGEAMTGALLARIRSELRLGRSFLVVTQSRALLEACDKLVVLEGGRMIEYGDAAEIRRKQSTGWSRFAARRRLEVEDGLLLWLRSQFKRPGDEANRRKVGMVVSDLLAFSCQSADRDEPGDLLFEFKQYKGHCRIRFSDNDPPISTATLSRIRAELAAAESSARLSPLAAVMKAAKKFDCTVENDRRVIEIQVETFDPRQTRARTDDAPTRSRA